MRLKAAVLAGCERGRTLAAAATLPCLAFVHAAATCFVPAVAARQDRCGQTPSVPPPPWSRKLSLVKTKLISSPRRSCLDHPLITAMASLHPESHDACSKRYSPTLSKVPKNIRE